MVYPDHGLQSNLIDSPSTRPSWPSCVTRPRLLFACPTKIDSTTAVRAHVARPDPTEYNRDFEKSDLVYSFHRRDYV